MNLLERLYGTNPYTFRFRDPGVPPKVYGMRKRRHKYKRK